MVMIFFKLNVLYSVLTSVERNFVVRKLYLNQSYECVVPNVNMKTL